MDERNGGDSEKTRNKPAKIHLIVFLMQFYFNRDCFEIGRESFILKCLRLSARCSFKKKMVSHFKNHIHTWICGKNKVWLYCLFRNEMNGKGYCLDFLAQRLSDVNFITIANDRFDDIPPADIAADFRLDVYANVIEPLRSRKDNKLQFFVVLTSNQSLFDWNLAFIPKTSSSSLIWL